MSEKQWLATVIDAAVMLGWLHYHTHDSRRSAPGFPDLVLLRGARMIVAELKVGTAKTTPAQRHWLEAFGKIPGVQVYLWRPEDFERMVTVLRGKSA